MFERKLEKQFVKYLKFEVNFHKYEPTLLHNPLDLLICGEANLPGIAEGMIKWNLKLLDVT